MMPRRKPFEKHYYYHVFNRGFQKNLLFFSEKDYKKFTKLILYNIEKYKEIDVIDYSLLPNHFHFIIQSKRRGYYISKFIGNICAAYGLYYSGNYGRSEGLPIFEGRFKTKHLSDIDYLETCRYYVQNNPVLHKLVKTLDEWYYHSIPQNNKYISDKNEKVFKIQDIEK